MQNKNWRKGLVLGIMILFVGVTIVPGAVQSINTNNLKNEGRTRILFDNVFDSLIELCMKAGRIDSLSTCIIKNNEMVWSNGYGFSNKELKTPSTPETIYLIASISKTITATAILQQYDLGRIDLDDDVNGYLDFDLRNPYFPDVPITYRMLLNHTSSLHVPPSSFSQVYYGKDPPPLSSWLNDYFYDDGVMNRSKWRNKVPGSECKYSNLGFTLLGYLVEKITNQPFHQYCTDQIFLPLQMTNTSFLLSEINIDQHAIPYILAYRKSIDYPEQFIPLPHNSVCFYPAGGLRTTILDLSHFVIAHMKRGVYNDVRILNESTIEEMHNISARYNRKICFGLGWGIILDARGNKAREGHGGDLYGYKTAMWINPKENIAIVYFSTKDVAGGYIKEKRDDFPYRIIDQLLFQKAKCVQ